MTQRTMMKYFSAAALTGAAFCGTAQASIAFDFAPGSGSFPFTAPGGFVSSGVSSFTQTEAGVTLTAAAAGGDGNISVASNPNAAPTVVGLGVAGGGGAALQANGESLTFSFDQDVNLSSIVIDQHANPEAAGITLPGTGQFTVTAATTVGGTPPPGVTFASGSGGDATVDDVITFGTPFALSAGQTVVITNTTSGGFFVRSVTVDVIPEPASLALVGFGGLAVFSRRTRR